MSIKQILILIISVFLILAAIFGAIVLLYNTAPQYLGLPEKSTTNQTQKQNGKKYVDPKISITKSEYDELMKKALTSEVSTDSKDNLIKNNKALKDSLRKLDSLISSLRNTDKNQKNNNINNKNFQASDRDSINSLNRQLASARGEISNFNAIIQNQKKQADAKQDSLYNANLKDFSKIYENSSPSEVAKILTKIDEREAAKILKMISKKKAGKIIELLNPEQAAAILLLGGTK